MGFFDVGHDDAKVGPVGKIGRYLATERARRLIEQLEFGHGKVPFTGCCLNIANNQELGRIQKEDSLKFYEET